MSLLMTLLAVLGAGLILSALAYVTLLIGVLITSMVVLFSGPLVDRALGGETPPAGG